jgi:hypothetical protein
MDLTDEELNELHSVLTDKVYYGDDEIVYGDGPEAVNLRSALSKVLDECIRRGFWWAK